MISLFVLLNKNKLNFQLTSNNRIREKRGKVGIDD